MRFVAVLLTSLALAACSSTPQNQASAKSAAPAQTIASYTQKTPATPVEFLLDSAAKDFHAHPPLPSRFRNVRMGHVLAADGSRQYMLCGEFLPAQNNGSAEWMQFVTIKTSGYEQYIGGNSADFCKRPTMTWDSEGDLSSTLQSRFDSGNH